MLKVKKYRKMSKLTLKELSNKCNISISYLSEIENGIYENPGLIVICSICKALGVSPNELIDKKMWSNNG